MKLQKHAHDDILEWARRHPSIEVTGMVSQGADGWQRVHPMKNVAKEPEHAYEWGETDMRQTLAVLDDIFHEPVAFYHSHPSSSAEPSETDMVAALNVDMVYLIAGRKDNDWELLAWKCIEMGILLSEPLELT